MLAPGWFIVLYVAALGLIVGSFLNVVIHRLPRGESTVRPRSRCPACGAAIAARDNLPVLSWLLLGGRCRSCRAPISWRYPLVEAATALVFVGCWLRFGPRLDALVGAAFGAILIVLAGIDVDHLYLPDIITLPGIGLGLLVQPWLSQGSVAAALIGALGGAGVLLLLAGLWYLLRHEEGMGLGDVKMLAMIGAFLGWKGAAVALLVATLAGAAVGLTLLAARRSGWGARLPFGLFLAGGGIASLFAAPRLIATWLERF